MVLVDSRVVFGSCLERTLELTSLPCDIALEFIEVPTWANRADASSLSKSLESWYASMPNLPPPPTAAFEPAYALGAGSSP